jgi:hypothetical protein
MARVQLVSRKEPGREGRPARQVRTPPCCSAVGVYTTVLVVTFPSGLVWTKNMLLDNDALIKKGFFVTPEYDFNFRPVKHVKMFLHSRKSCSSV